MIFNLTKKDRAYVKSNGDQAICVDFVARRLKSRPKKIKVFFRAKNPRQSGWTKAHYDISSIYGGRVVLSPRSKSSLLPATAKILKRKTESHRNFWFKMESAD